MNTDKKNELKEAIPINKESEFKKNKIKNLIYAVLLFVVGIFLIGLIIHTEFVIDNIKSP
ncbi:MAG: hypothetical protein HPPSJP_2880 [Candidatus Hepatoplasma scabrum]|nr:MAG: hypothetical protein HPPSJP_2880 [Candidatus Hepatoplasma sp.]